jgi:hypothetical protein
MNNIAVLGAGTAGLISCCHLLAWLPSEYTVTLIHDPLLPILGIGESTSTQIPYSLYYGTGFHVLDKDNFLDSTVKHGVKYVNWRDREIFTKIPTPYHAIHFNNYKLKEFCIQEFNNRWGSKFEEIQGALKIIDNTEKNVKVLINDQPFEFDYVIDCGGYPTDYSDYDILDTIPVNHCLVHTVEQKGDWNFTYHIAHRHGWMFGIPLQTRQGWGYLYNDKITTKAEAIENLTELLPNVDVNKLREFQFKNYRAKKFIDNRIVKNGNKSLFYEPLEALSGWFYDQVIRSFCDVAVTKKLSREDMNQRLYTIAQDYELFICYMYHKGSTFDTNFWSDAKEKCSNRLNSSTKFKNNVKFLQQIKSEHYSNQSVVQPFSYDVWKMIDKDFGFNYFT